MKTALELADRGLIPLPLLKLGVRRLCTQRLRDERARSTSSDDAWAEVMGAGPIADVPEKANEQHYEVPPALFEACLGPHLKYSSGFFPGGDEDLETGEARMLELTCERAQLQDGQRILELGCGWGSLTLWMAEHYPAAEIVAVSNSAPQRSFIEARAAERGLQNIRIVTADMNEFDALEAEGHRFDRVVSVEMFEHMRDWPTLFGRVRGWLEDDGRMFIHIFTHRTLNYPFEVRDDTDWMSEHFFSGGMMPSDTLMGSLSQSGAIPFTVEEHAVVSGRHYSRTALLWRRNLESKKSAILPILERTYGENGAARWFQRWRLFFLACEVLFGYRGGSEWAVSHYRLAPAPAQDPAHGSTAQTTPAASDEVAAERSRPVTPSGRP